jgi:hypothetical protein
LKLLIGSPSGRRHHWFPWEIQSGHCRARLSSVRTCLLRLFWFKMEDVS